MKLKKFLKAATYYFTGIPNEESTRPYNNLKSLLEENTDDRNVELSWLKRDEKRERTVLMAFSLGDIASISVAALTRNPSFLYAMIPIEFSRAFAMNFICEKRAELKDDYSNEIRMLNERTHYYAEDNKTGDLIDELIKGDKKQQ